MLWRTNAIIRELMWSSQATYVTLILNFLRVLVFSVLSFWCFPGVWFILTNVSEHSICSIFKADDLEVM
jgi:hypothetical protein